MIAADHKDAGHDEDDMQAEMFHTRAAEVPVSAAWNIPCRDEVSSGVTNMRAAFESWFRSNGETAGIVSCSEF